MNPTVRTGNSNSPAILSAATALNANPARIYFAIQNLGTNALYVRLGAGASTANFHMALKAGAVNDDGTGASYFNENSAIYTGIVTIAGTSPRYTVIELAP